MPEPLTIRWDQSMGCYRVSEPNFAHDGPVRVFREEDVRLCEVCEKPTLEPIYHLTEGDAYCGTCVASLLSAEIEVHRRASRLYRDVTPEDVTDEMVERAADGLGRWWQERSHMPHRVDDDDRAMARAALAAAFDERQGT